MTRLIHPSLRTLLRLEGLALLGIGLFAYAQLPLGWGWFASLFLLPDLALLVYLHSARMGAIAYNATHSTLGAYGLLALGWWQRDTAVIACACIWLAHLGFDRALGYGLKAPGSFRETHLGLISEFKRAARAGA